MMRMMRRLRALVLKGMALAAILAFAVFAVSEIGPEVVTVETFGPDGTRLATRLWIVDAEGQPWVQAAVPNAEWLQRLESQPRVVVRRVTGVREFDAVPVREPEARERVQALMRAKYGLRDFLASLVRESSGAVAVPIRLDPVPVGQGAADGNVDVPSRDPLPSTLHWRARGPGEEDGSGEEDGQERQGR
jgi:hypothetical protein